jgi:hypothetical protein
MRQSVLSELRVLDTNYKFAMLASMSEQSEFKFVFKGPETPKEELYVPCDFSDPKVDDEIELDGRKGVFVELQPSRSSPDEGRICLKIGGEKEWFFYDKDSQLKKAVKKANSVNET